MLDLMCTIWISLAVPNQAAVSTKVSVPVKLVHASQLRFLIDASDSLKRFPNLAPDINPKRMLVYKSQCERL